MGKQLIASYKTEKTLRIHEGLAGVLAYQEQMCAMEHLRLWQDDDTDAVLAMIHFSAQFRDGYFTFYLNSASQPVRLKDDGGRTVKVRGLCIPLASSSVSAAATSAPAAALLPLAALSGGGAAAVTTTTTTTTATPAGFVPLSPAQPLAVSTSSSSADQTHAPSASSSPAASSPPTSLPSPTLNPRAEASAAGATGSSSSSGSGTATASTAAGAVAGLRDARPSRKDAKKVITGARIEFATEQEKTTFLAKVRQIQEKMVTLE